MTQEEFENQYAKKSGTTRDHLRSIGLRGYPCYCGEDVCEGWQLLFADQARTHLDLGHLTQQEIDEAETD